MLLTKIIFLIMIVVCIFFYILYLWDFALILLAVVCALPVIMFVITLILRSSVKAELILRDGVVAKNQSFPVQLSVSNKSIFNVGKAEAHIEYYNIFSDRITSFFLDMPIQANNSQRVTFQLSSKFCGTINIKIDYIRIFDPLRIFSFKIAKNVKTSLSVMPEIHEIDGVISSCDRISEESDVFSETKPGDDPSEIFDLREYIPVDRLNRIHWKLSSKKDDFIVKEYSLPVNIPSMIFLNMKCYEDSEYTLPVFDTLIETLVSLSRFMLENERAHMVVFYNGSKRKFVERNIFSYDDLAEMTRELIFSVNDNLYCPSYEEYFSDKNSLSLASFTFISAYTDSSVAAYINEYIDADIKNLLMVTKNSAEAEKSASLSSDVNVMPVQAGRITSSIKDIEL